VGELFESVGMDFKEFDVSNRGNRYALVFQDYLTKWPEVFPVAVASHCGKTRLGTGQSRLQGCALDHPSSAIVPPFQVRPNKWAQFKCLLFGLCTAPFIFSKVTNPVVQFL